MYELKFKKMIIFEYMIINIADKNAILRQLTQLQYTNCSKLIHWYVDNTNNYDLITIKEAEIKLMRKFNF